MERARINCKNLKEDALHSVVSELPLEQQVAVKTCVATAKLKNKMSMRNPLQWIYECLLLRIKSKKAYDHLRQHNILIMPTYATLNKYILEIKGASGFHKSTFACLEKKASFMNASDRRGKTIIN